MPKPKADPKKISTQKKYIDPQWVYEKAQKQVSDKDIAILAGISVDTLTRRFADILKKGRAEKNERLVELLWEQAVKGNITAQIWLSKNWLGYTDKLDQHVTQSFEIVIKDGGEDAGENLDPDPDTDMSIGVVDVVETKKLGEPRAEN